VPSAAYRALFAVAEKQMGYLTTAQAFAIGVQPMTLVMMKKRGTLQRASRGVYRLVEFPVQPLARYMEATLWPYEQRGVLSHATALALHRLVDLRSADVHITVPARFRIQRKVPTPLIVHRADLSDSEVCRLERLPVTTPRRTIGDCIVSNVDPAIVHRAIENARRATLLDAESAADFDRQLPGDPDSSDIAGVESHTASRALRAAQSRQEKAHEPMSARDAAASLGSPLDLGHDGAVLSQETETKSTAQARRAPRDVIGAR
jgi:hypothetical protein